MKKLTRAEETLMLILWRLEKAFLKDIVAAYPEPRPSQSTVSTLLRTLERKGFTDHRAYSKTFEYFPVVAKRAYLKASFDDLLAKYFGSSYEELIRFISHETELELRLPEPPESEPEPEPEPVRDEAQLSLW